MLWINSLGSIALGEKKKKDKFVDLKQEQHCNSTMPLLEMLQKAPCRNIPIAILVIIALS